MKTIELSTPGYVAAYEIESRVKITLHIYPDGDGGLSCSCPCGLFEKDRATILESLNQSKELTNLKVIGEEGAMVPPTASTWPKHQLWTRLTHLSLDHAMTVFEFTQVLQNVTSWWRDALKGWGDSQSQMERKNRKELS